MRKTARFIAVLLALSACNESIFKGSLTGGGARATTRSSLGKLTKIEKRPEIVLRGEPKPSIEAPRGQTLWVLWFEGEREIRFDVAHHYALVDKAGKEYALYFAGSPTPQGALTCEGWEFEKGGRLSMGGRWVYSGTVKLREPNFVFVYIVPATAGDLTLQDGDSLLPLEKMTP